MDPSRLLTLVGTFTERIAGSSTDEMGDPTTTQTETTWRCWLQQDQRQENTVNTDVQQSRWTLFIEPAAEGPVSGRGTVTIASITYEFDGPPWPAHNPRLGRTTHLEATLRRTT